MRADGVVGNDGEAHHLDARAAHRFDSDFNEERFAGITGSCAACPTTPSAPSKGMKAFY
jgi:hypothetical protein